jgi:hypothetical protein
MQKLYRAGRLQRQFHLLTPVGGRDGQAQLGANARTAREDRVSQGVGE